MKVKKILATVLLVTVVLGTATGCTDINTGKGENPNQVTNEHQQATEIYTVKTYKLLDPNIFPLQLEMTNKEIEVEKGNIENLVKLTYQSVISYSDGYLKKDSAVTKVEQKEGITYITLNEAFSKDWPGGTFYELIVFDTMTASFSSIATVDKIKYILEGEQPGLHIDLEDVIFDSSNLSENYEIVDK